MRQIELKKTDRKNLYRKCPQESDSGQLISESCELFFEGRKILTYLSSYPMEDLRRAVLGVTRIYSNRRQSGVASQSRTFGYMPRMPVQQRDYCYACTLHREFPASKETFFEYAKKFTELMGAHYPEHLEHSRKMVSGVHPDWLMPDSVFTSGILNYDNPLQYHYDAGNFKGTWSVMAVLKKQVAGGHLILPEYDIKLACQDSSIVIFDGQSELHGVSPIGKMTEDAYRYSLVWYSLSSIAKCGSTKEELRRAQLSRTKTEMKRAGVWKSKD